MLFEKDTMKRLIDEYVERAGDFSAIVMETKIYGTLKIIEKSSEFLTVFVSPADQTEMKIISNPLVIRALKAANARGVKITLLIPLGLYRRIDYLIPELSPEICGFIYSSCMVADNRSIKMAHEHEKTTFLFSRKKSALCLFVSEILDELRKKFNTHSAPPV